MSRVHDALRRAEQLAGQKPQDAAPAAPPAPAVHHHASQATDQPPTTGGPDAPSGEISREQSMGYIGVELDLRDVISRVREIPFAPPPDSLLIDASRPHEAPTEEFRALRTRLNHMQSLQPMHTLVVTSPSPAEGKSLTTVNLALAQSHLAEKRVLLADFDFRRPIIHSMFGIERSPGLTDYLQGKAPLEDCIKRVAGSNLYLLPAGEAVINPLELLNLKEVRNLLDQLPRVFHWSILDSPPLLFAADANLLSTLCHGTVLVVRIGHTTIDSVTRAMQSLCENNVVGIVVNGARRGELYSKYTYYHSYYAPKEEEEEYEAEPVEAGASEEK
jgi:protein-tyrosine kinase